MLDLLRKKGVNWNQLRNREIPMGYGEGELSPAIFIALAQLNSQRDSIEIDLLNNYGDVPTIDVDLLINPEKNDEVLRIIRRLPELYQQSLIAFLVTFAQSPLEKRGATTWARERLVEVDPTTLLNKWLIEQDKIGKTILHKENALSEETFSILYYAGFGLFIDEPQGIRYSRIPAHLLLKVGIKDLLSIKGFNDTHVNELRAVLKRVATHSGNELPFQYTPLGNAERLQGQYIHKGNGPKQLAGYYFNKLQAIASVHPEYNLLDTVDEKVVIVAQSLARLWPAKLTMASIDYRIELSDYPQAQQLTHFGETGFLRIITLLSSLQQ